MALINKPFVTTYGDQLCIDQIEKRCIPSLPMEPSEWKRQKGSSFKVVHVDIDCRMFKQSDLREFDDSILECPLFHLFIAVDSEDVYTSFTKDKFNHWIGALRGMSLDNWNVIIIPEDNTKQKNKFSIKPFSVINRLKADFNIQQIEKHSEKISDNPRERFDEIQNILRDLVLKYFDKKCFKNEDKIRLQRESQYTPQWRYFDYFVLQEELAYVYECLSLFEEALAQFDEAKSVFSKCLENYHKGEEAIWIENLRNIPFEKIECLILTNFYDPQKREALRKGQLCLADFRAFLLSKECALLQMLNRYKEIPYRIYLSLIEYITEYKLLDLDSNGNLNLCWLFLISMQALQRFNPYDCVDDLAHDYATLFRMALNSINKLANNLQVWTVETNKDWTKIESLIENITVLNNEEFGDTPSSRLAQAFNGQCSFQEFHSQLYEEAIIICKHINRQRSANFLGKELANLYWEIKQYEKAEPLYMKAIKCYRNENWMHLAMPLRLKLAVCQKDQFQRFPEKYLTSCVHLSGATFSSNRKCFNPDLLISNKDDHSKYFEELNTCLIHLFTETNEPKTLKLSPTFSLEKIELLIPKNGKQMIELTMQSYLPRSHRVNIKICGRQAAEIDFSVSEDPANDSIADEDFESCDLQSANEFLPIPLSANTNTSKEFKKRTKKKTEEIHPQSSFDFDIPQLNKGIRIKLTESIDDYDNKNSHLKLTCYPKIDAGLKAKKVSISEDQSILKELHESKSNEKEFPLFTTTFFPLDDEYVDLIPGTNKITFQSKNYGLFIPDMVKVVCFDGKAIMQEEIHKDHQDDSWTDMELLNKLLPSLNLNGTKSILHFDNKIEPILSMGLLSLPKSLIFVDVFVHNVENECHSTTDISNSFMDDVICQATSAPLNDSLSYRMHSYDDAVIFRIPGVMRRRLELSVHNALCITKQVFQTTSCIYIIEVKLNINSNGLDNYSNFFIKNPMLKLHHNIGLFQLLPLVHPTLSFGKLCVFTDFILLWSLESVDIVNFDNDSLQFTLCLDLSIENDLNKVDGNIVHQFELNI